MNRISGIVKKILSIIFMTLICVVTVTLAATDSGYYDHELANAAVKSTKDSNNNTYFNISENNIVGKTVKKSDSYGKAMEPPYERMGEYCIDSESNGSGKSYVCRAIIDLYPDGKINCKKSGYNYTLTAEGKLMVGLRHRKCKRKKY